MSKSFVEHLEMQCEPKNIRTEEEILKEFEKLGYEIQQNNKIRLIMYWGDIQIYIDKFEQTFGKEDISYKEANRFDMQEHKLLNELFKCWEWLDEKED